MGCCVCVILYVEDGHICGPREPGELLLRVPQQMLLVCVCYIIHCVIHVGRGCRGWSHLRPPGARRVASESPSADVVSVCVILYIVLYM